MCAKSLQKTLNSMVVRASKSFQYSRQITLANNFNRALPKFRYHALYYQIIKKSVKTNFMSTTRATHVCVSGNKTCFFFGNFGVLCFLETPVLRFVVLPYYRQMLRLAFSNRSRCFSLLFKLFL